MFFERLLTSKYFRVSQTDDVLGVEVLGGGFWEWRLVEVGLGIWSLPVCCVFVVESALMMFGFNVLRCRVALKVLKKCDLIWRLVPWCFQQRCSTSLSAPRYGGSAVQSGAWELLQATLKRDQQSISTRSKGSSFIQSLQLNTSFNF